MLGIYMKYQELNFIDFQKRFNNEASCRKLLFTLRWPNGFKCHKCKCKKSYHIKSRRLYMCQNCKHQESVTAGTIFHKTRMPLTVWFSLIFLMLREKHGISSLSAKRLLGIKSYRTVWLMCQKIRKALADRDTKYKLRGIIEVDETLIGGKKKGKRGRGAEGRTLVLFAAEKHIYFKQGQKRYKTGYCKAQVIPSANAEDLREGVKGKIARNAFVQTDGWKAYSKMGLNHFFHDATVQRNQMDKTMFLPCVHRLISNMKGNIRGTFHGIKSKYLNHYLGEFLYRYNRRKWEAQLFFSGLQACFMHNPYTLDELKA